MKPLKVGDTVKIITPVAKFSYFEHEDKSYGRDSTSYQDKVIGKKAVVVSASDTYPQVIKVKVATHKFYISEYTGWEFKKKFVISFAVQKIICK